MPGTAHPSALARALRGGRTYPPPRASGDVPAVVRGADVASLVRSTQAPTATGLRGRGVTVTGQLDLSHTEVPFPVTFEECTFEEPVRLHGSHLAALALLRCEVPAVEANGVQVDHDLVLSGSRVTRAVPSDASESADCAIWLCEATVGGRVLIVGTRIEAPGQRAVQADRIVVGGTMRLIHGFTARGELRLIGAQVHGSLDLTGAHVTDPYGGVALDLGNAHVDGSVFVIPRSSTGTRDGTASVVRPPRFEGRIDARNMVIGGRFILRDTTITGSTPTPDIGYSDADAHHVALLAPGLRIDGGGLEIQGASAIHGQIELEGCDIALLSVAAPVRLRAPGLDALRLSSGRLRAGIFLAPGLVVEGSLRFTNAEVGGNVALRDTTWSRPSKRGLVTGQGSLVRGELSMQGLVTRGGSVNLRGAALRGTVDLAGAELDNPDGLTVDLHQADVVGSVVLSDVTSTGCVLLSRARIAGALDLDRATLSCGTSSPRNPAGHALNVEFAAFLGGMNLHWSNVGPSVSVEGVDTTALADDPDTWPARVVLSGFRYQRFQRSDEVSDEQRWDVDRRLAWLARAPVFDPDPYEHLARVLREHGLVAQSERVLIRARRQAFRAERRGSARLSVPRRLGHGVGRGARQLFGAVTGQGYRPSRAFFALLALTAAVCVALANPAVTREMRATDGNGKVFSPAAARTPSAGVVDDRCGGGAVVCFNPAYFAIDTVVPLIGLGQRDTWHPDESTGPGRMLAFWLNVSTLLGWLLTSLFALALTKAVRVSP